MSIICHLCSLYSIVVNNLVYYVQDQKWASKLEQLYRNFYWECSEQTSIHLVPFIKQLVRFVDNPHWWKIRFEKIENDRLAAESTGLLGSSRFVADSYYSSIALMIYCVDVDYNSFLAMNTACKEYELCTNYRHYRIALLDKLIQIIGWPNEHILIDKDKDRRPKRTNTLPRRSHHYNVPFPKRSAIGTCNLEIMRFMSSARDATENFKSVNWSNDETFIKYLRQRDETMDVWMDVGQRSLRLYQRV
jgi:hypothetical protein